MEFSDIFGGLKDIFSPPPQAQPNNGMNDMMGMLGMALMNRSNSGGLLGNLMMMKMLGGDNGQQPQPQGNQPQVNNPMAPGASIGMPQTGDNIERIMNAIGQFESGNRYNEIGKLTKGDRAYGRYQIMGNNIGPWSKEALGYSVTPEQFLADPKIQDQIARHRMSQYWNQYGNINDVASMWFSGRPYKNNNSRDILGTSVPQYISAINKNYYGH